MMEKVVHYPVVTVLMSVYKGARWLNEQLDSIIGQKGVDVRLLIRDDGSPDDGATLDVLKEFKRLHPDVRMRIIEGDNVGFVESFSLLLREALKDGETQFFSFSDQDDVWLEEKLSVACAKLRELAAADDFNKPMMYCSNTLLVDQTLSPIRLSWPPKDVRVNKSMSLVRGYATGCTMVFNRAAAEVYCSRYDDGVRYHDYFMYMICVFFGHVFFDSESHILYRQHGNNQIGMPNAFARWRRRLSMKWDSTHVKESMARHFLTRFGDMLPEEDVEILGRVAFYRKNLLSRLALMLDRRFRQSSVEANVMQNIKIIAGLL